jgi:hypothetical protein
VGRYEREDGLGWAHWGREGSDHGRRDGGDRCRKVLVVDSEGSEGDNNANG